MPPTDNVSDREVERVARIIDEQMVKVFGFQKWPSMNPTAAYRYRTIARKVIESMNQDRRQDDTAEECR